MKPHNPSAVEVVHSRGDIRTRQFDAGAVLISTQINCRPSRT